MKKQNIIEPAIFTAYFAYCILVSLAPPDVDLDNWIINSSIQMIAATAAASSDPASTKASLIAMWTGLPLFTIAHALFAKKRAATDGHQRNERISTGLYLSWSLLIALIIAGANTSPEFGKIGTVLKISATSRIALGLAGGIYMTIIFSFFVVAFSYIPKAIISSHRKN